MQRSDAGRTRGGKKKVGGDLETSIKRSVLEQASSCFHTGIRQMQTHGEILSCLRDRVYGHHDIDRLTSTARAEIRGFIDGQWKVIDHHFLIWMMWYDGALRTREEIDYIRANVDESVWSKIEGHRSCHVWENSLDPSRSGAEQMDTLRLYNDNTDRSEWP